MISGSLEELIERPPASSRMEGQHRRAGANALFDRMSDARMVRQRQLGRMRALRGWIGDVECRQRLRRDDVRWEEQRCEVSSKRGVGGVHVRVVRLG